MSRLSDYAAYITAAQKSSFTALDGAGRLAVVKGFYNSKSLELPVSITVATQKRGAYLSKDEKIRIQAEYIQALQSGNVSDSVQANFNAVVDPDAVCTFAKTLGYTDALKEWGPAVVAAKLLDALSVADNEEFHKIRKFDVPAAVAVSELPAFIKELQAIYDAAQAVEE